MLRFLLCTKVEICGKTLTLSFHCSRVNVQNCYLDHIFFVCARMQVWKNGSDEQVGAAESSRTLTVCKKKEEKNLQNSKNEKVKLVLIILSDSQIDNRVYPFTIKSLVHTLL